MEPSTRKVVTRSPHKTVRIINLRGRLQQPVEAESKLERDFVQRGALCPDVLNIVHQPFRIELPDGRFYHPDFLVSTKRFPPTVVEVKIRKKSRATATRSPRQQQS